MRDMDREMAAREFAVAAHGSQEYAGRPYVEHLDAVRKVLDDFGQHGDLGVAAYLHDVIEDTPLDPVKVACLLKDFGPKIADLVWAVTGIGSSRKRRNRCIYGKLSRNPEACVLKLADRIANVEACIGLGPPLPENRRKLAQYAREHAEFSKVIADAVPFSHPLHAHPVISMMVRLDNVFSRASLQDMVKEER